MGQEPPQGQLQYISAVARAVIAGHEVSLRLIVDASTLCADGARRSRRLEG
jgi:hypothetical protein